MLRMAAVDQVNTGGRMRKEQITWDGIGEISIDELSLEGCQNLVIAYVESWMRTYEKAFKGYLQEEKAHLKRTSKCMFYLGTIAQAKTRLRRLNYLNYATSFDWDSIFKEKEKIIREDTERSGES